MSRSFDLSAVDRITVGTVGPAGQRTFFLQVREETQLVTLKIEKRQLAVLVRALQELLNSEHVAGLPAITSLPDPSELELEDPILPEWAVGTLGISLDIDNDQVVIVAEELVIEPADPDAVTESDDSGGMARFAATRRQIAGLIGRATELLGAGREICELCGYPKDPEGHSCPRTNGHKSPTL
jgi:uncharacterized repeat protein (TIGR03847 family)